MVRAKQNTSHHNTYTSRIEGVLSANQEIADTSMPDACLYLHCLFAKLKAYVNVGTQHRTRCYSNVNYAPLSSLFLPICQSTAFNHDKTDDSQTC